MGRVVGQKKSFSSVSLICWVPIKYLLNKYFELIFLVNWFSWFSRQKKKYLSSSSGTGSTKGVSQQKDEAKSNWTYSKNNSTVSVINGSFKLSKPVIKEKLNKQRYWIVKPSLYIVTTSSPIQSCLTRHKSEAKQEVVRDKLEVTTGLTGSQLVLFLVW